MKGLVNIEFLNFNCTYGKNSEPFLAYFTDIVWPSLHKGYRRVSKGDQFLIDNVEIKELEGYGLVLIGVHIRSTELEIKSEYIEGKGLVPMDKRIPSGPYSAFAIFLKNHRMIHIKNQKGSPTSSQLGATFQTIMNKYVRDFNKEVTEKSLYLPYSHVNVTNIPDKSRLKTLFNDVKKVNNLNIRLYALNGDVNNGDLLDNFQEQLGALDSDTGSMNFPSPNNINNVELLVSEVHDLGKIRMETVFKDGTKQTITNDHYKETYPMYLPESEDNINENIMRGVNEIKSNIAFRYNSEKNEEIYNLFFEKLKGILINK